nr:Protein VAP-1, isoform a [Haemonchus contortus]
MLSDRRKKNVHVELHCINGEFRFVLIPQIWPTLIVHLQQLECLGIHQARTCINWNLSSIPIAAAFELWWGNHEFGAFINSTAVYDPTFDYTLFSQMVAGYAVGIGCTDTCYGKKSVFCSFLQCTAMSDFGMIYEVGSGPCMVDDDCSTFPDSTCNQENGLCIKKPNTPLCPPGVYPNV